MPLLTMPQAAASLGQTFGPEGRPFSPQTVSKWMKKGMPYFKVGHRAMFDADAIQRWATLRFVRNPERVSR